MINQQQYDDHGFYEFSICNMYWLVVELYPSWDDEISN